MHRRSSLKVKLSLFLFMVIAMTAVIVSFSVQQLAIQQFKANRDQRIHETQQQLLNRFRSFDLFMNELEAELDLRMAEVLPKIAQRIAQGPEPNAWSLSQLTALAREFSVGDIYLIDHDLKVFNTTFKPDMGLNLGQLGESLKTKLEGLQGSGRLDVDRISMSNQTGIIKKYAYHGPVGKPYLVEVSINMWEGAETFGSMAQKRFFLEEFFQSLVDSNDILKELDLFIADDLAQWSVLHEGTPMDPQAAAQLKGQNSLEQLNNNLLTIYTIQARRENISGFRFYSKTVFDTAMPADFYRGVHLSTLGLALVVALLAYLLVDRLIFRQLYARVQSMDQGLKQMREGALNTRIPVIGDDELTRITLAINELAMQVHDREQQLTATKEDLEKRVAARTLDLQTSMRALSEREANYRYLVEHARSIILRWKPDGVITFCNDYALSFFGYSEQALLGSSVYETIVPNRESSGRNLHQRVDEVANTPNSFTFHENENICKDGRRVWVAWANRAILDEQGQLKELLSVGADITHLKMIQQELTLARDAANAANRAKSAFLAVMSHEIRTPMNSILGMTDLLMEHALDAEQRHALQAIARAGDALMIIINDILDLSKIEADRLELELVETDLDNLMANLGDMLTLRAQEKGVKLSLLREEQLSPYRWCDQVRLRQILVNLIGNAIKFTHQGSIEVKLSKGPGNRIRFSVSDSGIGIDLQQQEAIFESFNQGDSSVTRRYGGTGLGLSISQRLVKLMGGVLKVYSRPGKGSTFFFTIPMAPVPHLGRHLTHIQNWEQFHLLLVEPVGTTSTIGQLLTPLGMQVSHLHELTHISQVVAQLDPIDLLLINLDSVEDETLNQSLQQVHDHPASARLPLLLLLPEPDHTRFEMVKGIGGHCLAKPVRRQGLIDAMELVIGAKHATQEAKIAGEIKGLKILIAEDSDDNILLLQSYLKGSDHQLTIVRNGLEALQQVEQHHFDLVLMDVQMPVMDGLEATRKIRLMEQQQGARQPLPIVTLTAHAMLEDKRRSVEAGCTDHLTKPIKKQVLLKAIAKLMQSVAA
ncbi:PAS/PAC sensor hybrid histidine kinase [Magnetococcus marinus MC-1]|uniref:histidine kinase n=1 Tax=Magnetococcus marinus (strain ATCC BAA-1437 / JCM 17883 / MC-1) TaxID=156889 RepID=A0L9T7_MAGMM|nr:ATP-binding protein [Magnetococcus marinus]ABK44730.1 PAS/PAC sensor hybrid histidine kinase [Magnetococcus marinus MC-1]